MKFDDRRELLDLLSKLHSAKHTLEAAQKALGRLNADGAARMCERAAKKLRSLTCDIYDANPIPAGASFREIYPNG